MHLTADTIASLYDFAKNFIFWVGKREVETWSQIMHEQ